MIVGNYLEYLTSILTECLSNCEGLYPDRPSARVRCYEVCLGKFERLISASVLNYSDVLTLNSLLNDCRSLIDKAKYLSKLCSDRARKALTHTTQLQEAIGVNSQTMLNTVQQMFTYKQQITVSPETKPLRPSTESTPLTQDVEEGRFHKLRNCGDYIVNIVDIGHPLNRPDLKLLILEYVNGVSLKDFIQGRKKIHWNLLRHLMYQLLYAVACIHSAGVVHRDIRPGNVIVDEYGGKVKLIDFSTAKFEGESDGWIVEAPGGYTAPEQRDGRSSKASDVYSLGATLLFMLTGEDPGNALQDIDDVKKRIKRRVEGINDDEVRKLLAFVGKAMSPEPRQRFRDAVGMARVFHEVFYEGKDLNVQVPLQATPYTAIPEECRPTGRRFRIYLTVMLINGNKYERYDEVDFEAKDGELIVIGREQHRGFVKVERHSGVVYVLINDPYQYVSRSHCIIYWCGDKWFVRDVSQNGTWVTNPSGKRIYLRGDPNKSVELNNDDYLLLAYVTQGQPYVSVLFSYQVA
jgi:serine/threonine protein kinase